jgi:hypothetical protein
MARTDQDLEIVPPACDLPAGLRPMLRRRQSCVYGCFFGASRKGGKCRKFEQSGAIRPGQTAERRGVEWGLHAVD